jgi:hypothetical protein
MLRRTPGPQMPVLGGATGPWAVLAVSIGAVAMAWLAWLSACVAAVLSGGRVSSFGARWLIALVLGRTAQTWPGTPTVLVVICGAILASLLAVTAVRGWRFARRYLPRHGDPVAELARNAQVTEFSGKEAARKAIRLRPSLSTASPQLLASADTGLLLGHLKLPTGRGPALYASWEDTTIAVMAPRSGKTTALAIPYVLSAPGPVGGNQRTARRDKRGGLGLRPPAGHGCHPVVVVGSARRLADQGSGHPSGSPLRRLRRR